MQRLKIEGRPVPDRVDTASRLIAASPQACYAAFVDPGAMAQWRPPKGMTAIIDQFDARVGGAYRMAFVHSDPAIAGKTEGGADVFNGQFLELTPGRRIVERGTFETGNAAFEGAMTVTTDFVPEGGGTRVTFSAMDVPPGISETDHAAGMASSLANLAAFVERA